MLASPEVVHRPRSDPPLHFDIRNLWQTRTQKYNTSSWRLLPVDMLERWPQVCRIKITFTLLLTNYFRTNADSQWNRYTIRQ